MVCWPQWVRLSPLASPHLAMPLWRGDGTDCASKPVTMKYAINYVSGYNTRTLVVDANDADEAYSIARDNLVKARLYSAALQGSCRIAGQADIDAAARDTI